MSKRNYERLDIHQFGAHLLDSGDLDPVYIMLHKAELPEDQLKRWLVAYWCLYHCGAASWLSEHQGGAFWSKLLEAAANTDPAPTGGRWPRGHERRHFRGGAAVTAVRSYRAQFLEPETLVDHIAGNYDGVSRTNEAYPFKIFADRAQELPLCGPWISFKIADMLDRVLGVPVDFDQAAVFMFDQPRSGALRIWRESLGLPENAKPKNEAAALTAVVEHLALRFKDYTAPPLHDRPVGLQEIETIICKHGSHLSGHYPLYNDIDEIGAGLGGWGKTADLLRCCLPRGSTVSEMPKTRGCKR